MELEWPSWILSSTREAACTWQRKQHPRIGQAPRRIRARLFRNAEAVDVDFEHMVDADAVDAVGLGHGAGFGFGMDDGAVDDEVDLVGADADFKRVGGFAGV